LERLKKELLFQRLGDAPRLNSYLRRAANEAAPCMVTPYPLLVFPALFEEKADLALAQAVRQEQSARTQPGAAVCMRTPASLALGARFHDA